MSTARRGKIASLPHALRAELNQRMRDGARGTELIEWLNGLPEVKSILEARFDGKPINDQNLCDWRQGGYAEWESGIADYEQARKTTEHAQFICHAMGLDPSDATSMIVTGQLVRIMSGQVTTDDLGKIAPVFSAISKARSVRLAEKKFMRETVEDVLELIETDRARAIVTEGGTRSEVTEKLGQAIFGEDWK